MCVCVSSCSFSHKVVNEGPFPALFSLWVVEMGEGQCFLHLYVGMPCPGQCGARSLMRFMAQEAAKGHNKAICSHRIKGSKIFKYAVASGVSLPLEVRCDPRVAKCLICNTSFLFVNVWACLMTYIHCLKTECDDNQKRVIIVTPEDLCSLIQAFILQRENK